MPLALKLTIVVVLMTGNAVVLLRRADEWAGPVANSTSRWLRGSARTRRYIRTLAYVELGLAAFFCVGIGFALTS